MIETGFGSLFYGIADVYPLYRPEETALPVISYRLLSSIDGPETHDGFSGIVSYHFQFTVHAETHQEAREIARLITQKLRSASGNIGESNVRYTNVTNSFDVGHFPEWGCWQFAVDAIFHVQGET